MMIDPAPVRVGQWPQEWQKWFEQVRKACATLSASDETVSASTRTLEAELGTVTAAVRALEAAPGASLDLATNSRLNGNQENLNLVAGANVSLTEDGNGNVTIASTAATTTTTGVATVSWVWGPALPISATWG
jgi:hypothetical protein